jgi:hypothetical protein
LGADPGWRRAGPAVVVALTASPTGPARSLLDRAKRRRAGPHHKVRPFFLSVGCEPRKGTKRLYFPAGRPRQSSGGVWQALAGTRYSDETRAFTSRGRCEQCLGPVSIGHWTPRTPQPRSHPLCPTPPPQILDRPRSIQRQVPAMAVRPESLGAGPCMRLQGRSARHRAPQGYVWQGDWARDMLSQLTRDMNAYYCVSLFSGHVRQKPFQALHVLGPGRRRGTKVSAQRALDLLGEPSYRIETSPGNEQWGYRLAPPVVDCDPRRPDAGARDRRADRPACAPPIPAKRA